MEAILKFNLDDIDDRMAHRRCIKSLDMALALWDYLERKLVDIQRRLDDQELSEQEYAIASDMLEDVKTDFLKSMEEYNINLDELVQ